jgi:hypothetical protein
MSKFRSDFWKRLTLMLLIAVLSFILSGASYPSGGEKRDPAGDLAAELCAEFSDANRASFESAAQSSSLWLLQSMTR